MEEPKQTVKLVKQEQEEDNCLYPFVCGICGYRFNRMKEFCKHFEEHSDMVTSEYFHSCHIEPGEEDLPPDKYDNSAKFYSCGVCSQDFASLCLMHDHFAKNYDGVLYLVDTEKKKGIPKHRRCAGSVFTGSMNIPEYGEIVKVEVNDEDGDDDMEYDDIMTDEEETEMTYLDLDEEPESPSLSQEKNVEASEDKTKSQGDLSENGISIHKITVNYGDHSETYDVGKNDAKQQKGRVAGETDNDVKLTTTESEADEDMSDDLDKGEHNYGLSSEAESPVPKTKRRVKRKKKNIKSEEDLMFEAYEMHDDLKNRRRDSIPVPSSEIREQMGKAKAVIEDDGTVSRVYCPVCNKIIAKSYLYQHFKKAHSDEEFPCDQCGKIFTNKGYRNDHVRFHHQRQKKSRGDSVKQKYPVNCKPASRAILEQAKLVGEEKGTNTKVECPVCKKVLLRHYLVKHHQKLHSDKKYPCDQCDKVFQYNGYLADHKRYVHLGIKKKSVLTRNAKDRDLLALCDSAQPTPRKRGEKPKVTCPKCDKKIQQEYLAKHIRAAHSDQKFPCDICGKVYTCKRFLFEHQKYVHMEKDTECEICHKMFKGIASKEKHKRLVHTTDRPFQCSTCEARFRTSFECKRHLSQHEDVNLFPYQCPKCERRFKSQKSMFSHERSVHRRVGRLQCKWPGCNSILNDKATFRKHYCIHTGEKPNKCPVCGKGFIQRVALKYHLKTKHDSEHKMPPGRSPALGEQRTRNSDVQLFREAQPVPLDPDEYVEEYTEVPVESIVDGTEVNLTDASIVSNLIEIAQSSEGGTVPEALQHVFDGENRTIVIYYQ